MRNFSKIIIGGAQIGMKYGISNKTGEILEGALISILKYCYKNKIYIIDTATGYKKSISKLQKIITKIKLQDYFKLIIKISNNDLKNISTTINKYQKKPYFYCIMAHTSSVFLNKEFQKLIYLNNLERDGLKIGVSIYDKEELKVLKKYYKKIDIIQLPYNILNSHSFSKNILRQIKKYKIKIHARSIFHQGFLFLPNKTIKSKYPLFGKELFKFKKEIETKKTSISQLSLSYVSSNKLIDNLILGVDSLSQLKKNLKQLKKNKISKRKLKKIQSNRFKNIVPNPRDF